jgi:hypothetical protein
MSGDREMNICPKMMEFEVVSNGRSQDTKIFYRDVNDVMRSVGGIRSFGFNVSPTGSEMHLDFDLPTLKMDIAAQNVFLMLGGINVADVPIHLMDAMTKALAFVKEPWNIPMSSTPEGIFVSAIAWALFSYNEATKKPPTSEVAIDVNGVVDPGADLQPHPGPDPESHLPLL